MKIKLNREYAMRHFGVVLLMIGLAGWFAYDGFIEYPQKDEAYFETLHLKKDNAIQRQKEFMVLALVAALLIGGNLWKVSRFSLEFDDDGFVLNGVRKAYGDIKSVSWKFWEKKSIVIVDGTKVDAWHHTGVKEFAEKLRGAGF